MSIAQHLLQIKASLPKEVTLVAVSKTKPLADLQAAYAAGQRVFGENKIQEMTDKWEHLPKDIDWHMIGHVQSNKVKYMAPYVKLIHGVDRLSLLDEINKQAAKNNRNIDCLLQVHIAQEETKFGFDEEELRKAFATNEFAVYPNVNIVGLMGMASFTSDNPQVKTEFTALKSLFDSLKNTTNSQVNLQILSMGMSGDYEMAIACGSNMVRIGNSIFGSR
ncbi:MAG: YggS family pyridoxal phosphate-dependent enzyme [Flavobacterium sp.]|nr:YggS family pyridoxal phosphate-dependent enzyme [Flavobacterium sp.]